MIWQVVLQQISHRSCLLRVQTLPSHSTLVPINVRCYSHGDIIVRRSEVTLRAKSGSRPLRA